MDRAPRHPQPRLDTSTQQLLHPHGSHHVFDHREFIAILAAIHHATDAVTQAGRHDHQAVWTAATDMRLLTVTSPPPLAFQIPYRYLSASTFQIEDVLAIYGAAVQASTRATAALDQLAANLDTSTAFFTAIHAAARRHTTPTRPRARKSVPLALHRPLPRPPGQIKWKLHHLGITDPHLIARAKAATRKAGIRTTGAQPSKSRNQHPLTDAVCLAAQDCPRDVYSARPPASVRTSPPASSRDRRPWAGAKPSTNSTPPMQTASDSSTKTR